MVITLNWIFSILSLLIRYLFDTTNWYGNNSVAYGWVPIYKRELKDRNSSEQGHARTGKKQTASAHRFFTWHCHLKKYMSRIGLKQNSDCRFSGVQDESPVRLTQVQKSLPTTSARTDRLWRNTFSETITATKALRLNGEV